jgi:hypothetical protein
MFAQANFLTAPDSYAFDLPDMVDQAPTLYGVVRLDGGARELTYEPRSYRSDPDLERSLAHRFDVVRDRIRVSVYERREEPSDLIAFWRLIDGYLITFVDDQLGCGADLESGIRTVIANLSVRVTKSGLPAVELRAPLVPGDIRDPFQREMITFRPREEPGVDWPVVKIIRQPPWAYEGSSSWQDELTASRSVTNALGITVECMGPRQYGSQLQQYAADTASSVVPVL